jgi:pimeloyl-ACP methyl ester carboxylesterase
MFRSIYKNADGRAAILRYYDEAVAQIGVPMEDRTVKTRFGDTHLLVAGPEHAPPLVIFHGGNVVNPVSLRWFAPLLQAYRVYAPDTIGHPGKSAETRVSPRDDSYGQWAVDLLDGLGLENVPMIGPSYGGGILLRTAAFAPDRIAKAVLLVPASIAHGPLGPMMTGIVGPMLHYKLFPNRARLARAVMPMFTEAPDERLLDLIHHVYLDVTLEPGMPKTASKAELAGFTAPTLLVAAEKDVFFPANRVIPRAKEIIPNLVRTEVLQGSCHYPSREGIRQINRWIRSFLMEV